LIFCSTIEDRISVYIFDFIVYNIFEFIVIRRYRFSSPFIIYWILDLLHQQDFEHRPFMLNSISLEISSVNVERGSGN